MKKLIYTLFVIASAVTLFGQHNVNSIINVPADYTTIQEAIDASVNGDTIIVSPGTYYENINFNGKGITLASEFLLTGDNSTIRSTTIDGSNPVHPDTASCVLMVSGEDSTSVLCGFTLTGGTGTLWEDEHGPGYFYTEGGGILIQAGSPIIRNNIISYNEAVNKEGSITSAGGGGIRCGDGNPSILNNIIIANEGLYGAGIVLNYSGAVIKNNLITENVGGEDFGGGGIWAYGAGSYPKIIENNTISFNHSYMGGGGLRVAGTEAILTNNIIYGNTASYYPQIWSTQTIVSYCNVEGGWEGEGNIDEDPLFMILNLVLQEGSPCIDAGNPDASFNDPEDPMNTGYALSPSRGQLQNDMGAYGGPGALELPPVMTAIDENASGETISDPHIYPNPATDRLFVSFRLLEPEQVIINLRALSGETVITYYEEGLNEYGDIELPIRDLAKGIYLLQLQTTHSNHMKKVVIH